VKDFLPSKAFRDSFPPACIDIRRPFQDRDVRYMLDNDSETRHGACETLACSDLLEFLSSNLPLGFHQSSFTLPPPFRLPSQPSLFLSSKMLRFILDSLSSRDP
jgi:hypothetical protein